LKSNRKWLNFKVLFLIAAVIATCLVSFGCVKGLTPIGWSGGTVADGTLYVGSKEGRLVEIGLADESRRWADALKATRTTGFFGCSPATGGGGCGTGSAGVAIYGNPVVVGDRVYIGGYNGKVYSYYTESLQMDEDYPPENYLEPIVGGLATDQDNIYFGCSDGKVYALSASDLILQWKYETSDKIWATPAISGDTVYIGSFDKKLYALSAADGSKKWEFTTEGAIIATPLVDNDTVYIGSLDRNLYALNTADGSLKWQFTGENWFWAEPVIYNGIIYAGCLDGNVYALDAATGNKVTEFDLGSPVSSAPVIVGNSIIFASRKGMVYAIDLTSHEMRQLADFDTDVNGPLAAYEGIVYIHTQELTLERVNALSGAVLSPISLESQG
jgi:outer membrane protein assembly factor BamB